MSNEFLFEVCDVEVGTDQKRDTDAMRCTCWHTLWSFTLSLSDGREVKGSEVRNWLSTMHKPDECQQKSSAGGPPPDCQILERPALRLQLLGAQFLIFSSTSTKD